MREVKATIDDSGKLTIPSEYRQVLGLKAGDEVMLRLEVEESEFDPERGDRAGSEISTPIYSCRT